jgi:hypothetical protein
VSKKYFTDVSYFVLRYNKSGDKLLVKYCTDIIMSIIHFSIQGSNFPGWTKFFERRVRSPVFHMARNIYIYVGIDLRN